MVTLNALMEYVTKKLVPIRNMKVKFIWFFMV